jgi:hypothetical protein
MSSRDWLSLEDFPFTEAELQRALALLYDESDAAQEARQLAATARECAAERAAQALRAGNVVEGGWVLVVPDVWFALIAELGPGEAARCEAWRDRARHAGRAGRERNAAWTAGLDPRLPPSAAIAAQLDSEDARSDAQWGETRADVRRAVEAIRAGAPRRRLLHV